MHLRRVLRNVKVICRRELELAVNPCVICSAKTFYNLVRKKRKRLARDRRVLFIWPAPSPHGRSRRHRQAYLDRIKNARTSFL